MFKGQPNRTQSYLIDPGVLSQQTAVFDEMLGTANAPVEINRHYGWCKFIIVVPSIAIREGVYKTFQVTAEHFNEDYGQRIKFFIYDSARLNEITHFASDNGINAMIINAKAFNAKGKNARRIRMELDEFRSRRPIDVIAKTNPILIIDEPQSVEGAKTKEGLKEFKPLVTLRYDGDGGIYLSRASQFIEAR